jgi:long-chain acyl-CoA synthetase
MLFTTPKIGHHDNRKLLHSLARDAGTVEEIVILRGPSGANSSYTSLINAGAREPEDLLLDISATVSPHDVCNLQFTSGTTGNPKAAMLTHQ